MKGNKTKKSRKKKPREFWHKNTCIQRGHPEIETFNSIDKKSFIIKCKICGMDLGKVTPLYRKGIESDLDIKEFYKMNKEEDLK